MGGWEAGRRPTLHRYHLFMSLSRRTIVLLVFLGWTFVGLYFATQAYYNPAFVPRLAWSQAIAVNLTYYYLWALCTPLVVMVGRRFRFDSGRWPRALLVHILAAVLITALQIIVAEFLLKSRDSDYSYLGRIRYAFGVNFHSSLPTYWLILFVYWAFDYYAKYRDRELRASQLEAQLSHASLQALKMQLNPHFLFNTLNSISSLMYSDVESADAMLARLSEFLRMTLDRDLAQEIPLEQELEFIRRYLEIEKIRFEERLTVKIDVDDAVGKANVPSLALQPLVENAIHHGIAPRPDGGAIEIRARRENESLHLTVTDDGVGMVDPAGQGPPERPKTREHIGLANTRARLERLYGDRHNFSFTDTGVGCRVDIVIPYRVGASA